MKITNCPNCGAPLNEFGHCDYCNTNIHIDRNISLDSKMELTLISRQGTEIHILPLTGRISELTIQCEANTTPDVSFTFEGIIK